MTTGSPIFKFGRRIVSLPSKLISITQGVPRTIAAVHCRRVKGCLRLHYTCFGSAEGACFGNCAKRPAQETSVLQRSRLLERFQDDEAAGEQHAVHDVSQCGTLVHYGLECRTTTSSTVPHITAAPGLDDFRLQLCINIGADCNSAKSSSPGHVLTLSRCPDAGSLQTAGGGPDFGVK
uniref:Uncharacterized protein n=1 Tax=Hyaloperonospora arabidopsidis (strain Emoy2) TaxID=559515 RepID=M4B3G1_HYAAE